jgi:aldehyde dehydrogenase (NAD+)
MQTITMHYIDGASGARVASQIRSGRVVINNMRDDLQAPWGRFKYCGVGREYDRYGIEAFFEPRAISE